MLVYYIKQPVIELNITDQQNGFNYSWSSTRTTECRSAQSFPLKVNEVKPPRSLKIKIHVGGWSGTRGFAAIIIYRCGTFLPGGFVRAWHWSASLPVQMLTAVCYSSHSTGWPKKTSSNTSRSQRDLWQQNIPRRFPQRKTESFGATWFWIVLIVNPKCFNIPILLSPWGIFYFRHQPTMEFKLKYTSVC